MATEVENPEVVYFLLPDGTKVSNDPRWYQEKFKEQMEQSQAELARLASIAAIDQKYADEHVNAQSEVPEDEAVEAAPVDAPDYSTLTVDSLKEEATARGLDFSALRKKSELVFLLEEDDLARVKDNNS